jgi:hypothetical protein
MSKSENWFMKAWVAEWEKVDKQLWSGRETGNAGERKVIHKIRFHYVALRVNEGHFFSLLFQMHFYIKDIRSYTVDLKILLDFRLAGLMWKRTRASPPTDDASDGIPQKCMKGILVTKEEFSLDKMGKITETSYSNQSQLAWHSGRPD